MTVEKKILQDPTPVPEDNPYVDEKYIGDPLSLAKQLNERKELYKRGLALKLPFVYESIAFYAGQQNMWWNPGTSRMEIQPVADPTRSTAINNRILNKCRAVLQRIVSFDPTSQCIPAGPSQLDIYAARMAKKIVESNHHDPGLQYKSEYEKFGEYVVIQGMGWLRTEWDHFGGRCSVTYKQQPAWVDIEAEAKKEGEGNYDELGEWEDNPMEEIEENGEQKTDKADGEVDGEGDEDKRENPDESGNGTADSETGVPENDESDEQNENEPNPGEGKPLPRIKKRIPKLDENLNQVYEPILDDQGNPQIEKIEYDGKAIKKAVGPLNMYYNPAITCWEDAFDCFEMEYLSIDVIKNRFPSCSDLSESDYERNSDNPWQMLFQSNLAKNPFGQESGIPVLTYFCKSCPDFPRGLKVVIIKEKIRVAVPMPTLNGDCLPYDFAGYIHLPGGFWYMSLPMYLKNPQLVLNKLLRQYLDHANQFAVPKILKRSDSKIATTITNGVEIISFDGDAPTFQNPQSTSGAHMEMIKFMEDAIDTNSGVNKTAEGNPPPNVTSGDMAEAITENDYQLHALDVDRVAQAICGSCNKEIRYIKENASSEILARFVGPGGKWMVSKFKKANLRNISDVIFIPGQAANLSRGQQRKDLNMALPIVLQGQGSPGQQNIIVNKMLEHLMWGEEEAAISSLNMQESYILDILEELEASGDNEQYDPTKRMMPWCDLNVWKNVIESVLLDYTDFNQKSDATKKRLIDLWTAVHNRQMQNQAAAPPAPGPQGPPPGMPPQGPPGMPQGQPAPTGAPQ